MRWAILGTTVASRKFVLGLRVLGSEARVTAVAWRNRDEVQCFAKDFGIATASADYVAVTGAGNVDAVYIAIPNWEHEAHSRMAIGAGKAVLVEKPLAMNAAAHRIVEAAHNAAKADWKVGAAA